MDKKVIVETGKQKQLFKVHEYDGRYTVYLINVGFFMDDSRKIGETRSLEDAITLIKASVDGSVRNVEIKNW
jgi:hypothetical protein